jgi:ribosomal protein L7/L12
MSLDPQSEQEVDTLIRSHRLIQAIKLVRERHPSRLGLKEAKEFVEARAGQLRGEPAREHEPAREREPLDAQLQMEIDTLLQTGKRIGAVKLLRERHLGHLGLKEAKDLVDARASELGIVDTGRAGCFIATAAYGDATAPEVCVLRRYRDTVLDRSACGRALIRGYYRVSPQLADWLSGSETWRRRARRLLAPVVTYCRRRIR